MTDVSSNNKRIAKNTVALYIRMLVIVAISLYTSRVVLATLGVSDFGIYNVVGGVVILFSFLNSSMASTTQRFLNIELGKGDETSATRVFSMGINCQFIIIGLFLLLAETIGLWYMNTYIKIPEGRMVAAQWVYQISVLTACVNIYYAPYNGAIIAYERMGVYAYVSIIEAVLKLGIVYLLTIGNFDKLILYGLLTLGVTIITSAIYIFYCLRNFKICNYHRIWDKGLFRYMMNFSGWSIFGNVANLGISQGLQLVQNFFFGVTMNAAMGVATQVNGAITRFLGGFTTAFNPQITKLWAAGDTDYFFSLVYRTTRFAFFMMFIMALPIFLCCAEIMDIWLEVVPEHAVSFCRLMIIYSLIDSVCMSLAAAVGAHGDIKKYQIGLSILKLLVIPLSIVGLVLGAAPEYVLLVNIVMNIATYIFRLFYLRKRVYLHIWDFTKKALFPCLEVALIAIPLPVLVYNLMNGYLGAVATILVAVISSGLSALFIGMTRAERTRVLSFVSNKLKRQ